MNNTHSRQAHEAQILLLTTQVSDLGNSLGLLQRLTVSLQNRLLDLSEENTALRDLCARHEDQVVRAAKQTPLCRPKAWGLCLCSNFTRPPPDTGLAALELGPVVHPAKADDGRRHV